MILYLSLAVVLALVVGGGTISLVNYYFQKTNDHALLVKMGLLFASLDQPLPLDLYDAVRETGLVITQTPPLDEKPDPNEGGAYDETDEELIESEFADIYVLPLTAKGEIVEKYQDSLIPVPFNMDALKAALQTGRDLRTIRATDGTPVRILTYRLPRGGEIEFFQIGRYLATQQQVLKQLLQTMVLAGGVITILFGLASWILAGKTLQPTQRAWDRQQAFIANASHELRAPLTLIHAGIEVALREVKSEPAKQTLTDVLSDANYMNELIEELLLLSRLDAQTLKLEIQSISLPDFMPAILRQVERLANESRVTLQVGEISGKMRADPLRMKQVLLIVLDNAIRNNHPEGWIKISSSTAEGKTTVLVEDSGQGIPQEYLDRVFDRFFKVHDRPSDVYRGSGLGLSIAKGMVEAQKGTILIDSRQDEGTLVRIIIPSE